MGFALYLILLLIPFVAVGLSDEPYIAFDLWRWDPVWLVAGAGVGLLLAGFQALTVRPNTNEASIWLGWPGWVGFVALMVAVGYIVVAEEVIWRGYLALLLGENLGPAMGLVLSSAAFALQSKLARQRHRKSATSSAAT